MRELHRAGDAELAEAAEVLRRDELGVLDPLAQAERRPERAASRSKASRASRLARSPIACTATGKPALAARGDDLRELVGARDLHAGAVEHRRRARAERAVHEHLQVAEPDELAPEAGADAERSSGASWACGSDCQTRRLSDPARSSCCQSASAPQAAVLVVHRGHPSRRGDAERGAHRLERLGRRGGQVVLLEAPGRLLAQDAGR